MHARGTFSFHDWIRENLARNTPYDQFVRAILAASGTPETAPAGAVVSQDSRKTDAFVDDTAQVFLGMRLQCAKCHHHPFEKWSQDDYYGFAAFFAPGRPQAVDARPSGPAATTRSSSPRGPGSVSHPKTGKTMAPEGTRRARSSPVAAGDDPRQKLVDWMADPKNPFFAKAVVNRYWAHFFGRGIVEPMDDIRLTNPPSNPELLDGLADRLREARLRPQAPGPDDLHEPGLRAVERAERVQRAATSRASPGTIPRRMSAEVLLDAIAQVTGVPTAFDGLPAGTRAIDLPDESVARRSSTPSAAPSATRPASASASTDASLGQSLMLLNSAEIQAKLAAAGGRAEQLVKDPRPDAAKDRRAVLGRLRPRPRQRRDRQRPRTT